MEQDHDLAAVLAALRFVLQQLASTAVRVNRAPVVMDNYRHTCLLPDSPAHAATGNGVSE